MIEARDSSVVWEKEGMTAIRMKGETAEGTWPVRRRVSWDVTENVPYCHPGEALSNAK